MDWMHSNLNLPVLSQRDDIYATTNYEKTVSLKFVFGILVIGHLIGC